MVECHKRILALTHELRERSPTRWPDDSPLRVEALDLGLRLLAGESLADLMREVSEDTDPPPHGFEGQWHPLRRPFEAWRGTLVKARAILESTARLGEVALLAKAEETLEATAVHNAATCDAIAKALGGSEPPAWLLQGEHLLSTYQAHTVRLQERAAVLRDRLIPRTPTED